MTNKTKGIISLIVAALGFALMSIFVKQAGELPTAQKVLFRNGVSMIIAFIIITYKKEKYYGSLANQKLLLIRSVFGTVGMLLFFYSIDNLIVSDANMLNKLSTFFLIIFSAIFLKEKIKAYQIFAILIALIGTLFIIKPEFDFDVIPYLTSITAAMFAGAAYTVLRGLRDKENIYTIVLYFSTFSCIILTPFVIINYKPMSFDQVLFLILTGLAATVGQFGTTLAYKFAPANQISIFNYTNVLFVSLLSIPLLSETPDKYSLLGYLIIFSASLYMYVKKQKS